MGAESEPSARFFFGILKGNAILCKPAEQLTSLLAGELGYLPADWFRWTITGVTGGLIRDSRTLVRSNRTPGLINNHIMSP